jgi:hypothetical protein
MPRLTQAKERTDRVSRKQAAASDPAGIAQLLRSAQDLIRTSYDEESAIDLIEQCIARLHSRHGVREQATDRPSAACSTSFPALARLLTYARADIAHELRDARSADLLDQCVERLRKADQLHRQAYLGANRTAH